MSETQPHLKDFYDDYYADGQSAWREAGARDKAEHIVSFCDALQPDSVLEVGSGEGSVLAELSRRNFGHHLHGVEISRSGLEAIKSRRIPGLESAELFDGYHLPFADKSMDVVVATHVLEHVEHERKFLEEIGRVGRYVFVEVPLEDTLRVRGAITNQIGHINFYNRHTFKALLESTGLRVERFGSFDHPAEVQLFHSRGPKSWMKMGGRRVSHLLGAPFAEHLFVFHAAALCSTINNKR